MWMRLRDGAGSVEIASREPWRRDGGDGGERGGQLGAAAWRCRVTASVDYVSALWQPATVFGAGSKGEARKRGNTGIEDLRNRNTP